MADPNVPEEELRRLEEELRRVKVSDVLVQTLYTVSSLGYQRLTPNERDLDQARLAIEAITALVPVLEGTVPADAIRDFSQVRRTCSWRTRAPLPRRSPKPTQVQLKPTEGLTPQAMPSRKLRPRKPRPGRTSLEPAEIGVFGGSGFYSFLDEPRR